MALDDLTKVAGTSCEEIIAKLDYAGIDYQVISLTQERRFVRNSEIRLNNFYGFNNGHIIESVLGRADVSCHTSKKTEGERIGKLYNSTVIYYAYYDSSAVDDAVVDRYRSFKSEGELFLVERTAVVFPTTRVQFKHQSTN